MLQDKIKEYLCSGNYEKFGLSTDDMAKDIAEICEVETTKKLLEATKIQSEIMIELREENAKLKAKLTQAEDMYKSCSDDRHSVITKSVSMNRELVELHSFVKELEEKISILEVKAVARNGRIMDLEQCYENMEDQRDELREQIRAIKYLNRQEVVEILHSATCLDHFTDLIKVTDKIMQLAIKPIDKDRIMDLEQELAHLQKRYDALDESWVALKKDKLKLIENLSNLAIKPIDKDRIIEVLKKHISEDCGTKYIWASHIETIANEICKEE